MPAVLVILIFVVYPIGAVVYYSFTEFNIVTPPEWVGFRNYQQLFKDDIFWLAIKHSFTYLLVTPILICLSILLAIVVNRKLPGIQIFRALFFIPVVSGSIAVGIAWRLMWDTNGIINGLLVSSGVLDEPVQWLAEPAYTLPIAMALTIWLGMGYYMMIFLAGLQNIPEELYDAAAIDGCNTWQKHWYVSIPGLRPQITFVAVISSLAALQVFNEIFTLTGGLGGILNSGVTMVFYLWRKAFRLNQAGMASAVAMVLLLITLAFSILNMRLLERSTEEQ
jgi:putative chitobiose transport system permease protein